MVTISRIRDRHLTKRWTSNNELKEKYSYKGIIGKSPVQHVPVD